MEHILDWHVTKDSVKAQTSYDEATKHHKMTSPIFAVDFGSVSTQWQIEMKSIKKPQLWGFYLRLLKMDTKVDGPTELQKRPGPVTQITVQCKLFLVKHSEKQVKYDSKLPKGNPTLPMMDFSFRSDIEADAGGIVVLIGVIRVPVQVRPLVPGGNTNRGLPDVRVSLECISSVPSMTLTSQGLLANLASDLGGMLASGQDSDIIIKCGSDSYPVHKCIISSKSPVFRAMLNSNMVEAFSGVITIEDVQPLVMKQFLNFVYTARVEFGNMVEEEVFDLITAADKYQVTVLKQLCFQHLINNINKKTCGKVAVAAYVYQAEVWQKNLIYPFIAKNWETLGADEEFQELVEAYPAAFPNKRAK